MSQNLGRVLKWKVPPQGWLKVNFDGAYNQGSGKAAIGFVIRDARGTFLGAVGKAISNVQSAEHAELMACKEAVSYVLTNALHQALFETDCLGLKQQLCQTTTTNTSALGRLYEDISVDLAFLPNSKVVHARREANKAALMVATYASSNDQSFIWSDVPFFLYDVIEADMPVP
ncbi:putative ribonuclease H-like domain-containing protein [Rosa chinensis]|uniref:Putative ribonuclease H-like domain-containing protein n=1 Tax=Rosa chinensis TaxID=74649 RepID=A0A2P6PEF0_ROSCH|nr:putative ribonuclease H-like domain-containing protein [Rosa chinensis]